MDDPQHEAGDGAGLVGFGADGYFVFRYSVSGIALSALLALIAEFRICASFLTSKVPFEVGVCGGFLGGISACRGHR